MRNNRYKIVICIALKTLKAAYSTKTNTIAVSEYDTAASSAVQCSVSNISMGRKKMYTSRISHILRLSLVKQTCTSTQSPASKPT